MAAHGLGDHFTRESPAVTGWGVGGPTRAYVVRMRSVAIGGVSIPNVVADFSTARGGNLSDRNFDGNVGGALLKRFAVTFDGTVATGAARRHHLSLEEARRAISLRISFKISRSIDTVNSRNTCRLGAAIQENVAALSALELLK